MGQPVPRPDGADAPPAPDPRAVEHAYRRHKARRHARDERARARRNAHIRFFVVVAVLIALCVVFALTAWRETQRLFGI
jgi:hypothetical protein